ncbi:FAD-dependent monooxygenase [Amaricoccus tamworthensis]|uniref:FAD-dependent monooxygenase n=1 Tax=Amaricoccus tamworthensis TaxID=57002 RepID=UPI003C7A5ACB
MYLGGRDVAVIGAGIGGLAAATAMAQRGAKVQVFERAEALTEVGAGIQVAPNGVSVLEALGLRDRAESVAAFPQELEIREHTLGRRIAGAALGNNVVTRYGRPYWQFHRADLLKILLEGAREAGVTVNTGHCMESVTRRDDGHTISFANGETADTDIVIAADGVRSSIRKTHFQGPEPRFTGHVAWRGLVPVDRLPDGIFPNGPCITMGPKRHVVTYPLRGGRLMNFVAVEERENWVEEGWMSRSDPDELRAAFPNWAPSIRALFAAVEETFLWGLFDHKPLPRWVNGRMALLGDACHPMLPFLAQGATMALEDAWVLAAELDVARDPERGLTAYEARREPRAARVQQAAAQNGRIYHLGPGVGAIAQFGLSTMSQISPDFLLSRFDWIYSADVVSAEATG